MSSQHHAQNLLELKANIARVFHSHHYGDQPACEKFASALVEYFDYHQFDEWSEIVDDMCNGYDDCCCKEVLFEHFPMIRSEQDKQMAHQRLTQCVPGREVQQKQQQQNNNINISNESSEIAAAVQRLQHALSTRYGASVAQRIAALFEKVVSDEGFEDMDGIRSDVGDPTDSLILASFDGAALEMEEKQEWTLAELVNDIQRIVLSEQSAELGDAKPLPSSSSSSTHIEKNDRDNHGDDGDDNKHKEQEAVHEDVANLLRRMREYFTTQYANKAIGAQIVRSFLDYVVADGYEDLSNIQDDIADIADSDIWSHVRSELEGAHSLQRTQMNEIIEAVQALVRGDDPPINTTTTTTLRAPPAYFTSIDNLSFRVTADEVKKLEMLIRSECPKIYNIAGISKIVGKNEQNKIVGIKSGTGVDVAIAKSLDIANNLPLVYWLINLFKKERLRKYCSGDLDMNATYLMKHWFKDNRFCRYLTQKAPSIAQHVESGIQDAMHRQIKYFNYNRNMWKHLICDKYVHFVLYAMAFQDMVDTLWSDHLDVKMSKGDSRGKLALWCPLQIDIWIIPQMVQKQNNQKQSFNPIELPAWQAKPAMGDYIPFSECGDLETILQQPSFGYVQGKDYLVEKTNLLEHKDDLIHCDRHQLSKQLLTMLQTLQKDVTDERRNRYIFIIDRRNPRNARKRSVDFPPNSDFSQTCSTGPWRDKIYLLAPKQTDASCVCNELLRKHCRIPERWHLIPEICFYLSTQYVWHDPTNRNRKPSEHIQFADALEGYNFGLSYHMLAKDAISAYWYYNGCGTVLSKDTIQWLWPQFFKTVNKSQQTLNSIARCFGDTKWNLPNHEFEKFEQACQRVPYF